MYGLEEQTDTKAMRYIDPDTRLPRRVFIAFADAINQPRIIGPYRDDWVYELGDQNDRANIEALATWVSRQKDVFSDIEKRDRVTALRYRFEATMKKWMDHYISLGFKEW